MQWLVGKLFVAFQFLAGKETSRQRHAGFALGLWIGLVPKDNLTAAALMTLLLATRASVSVGLLTSAVVALFAPFADPIFDRMGHLVLGYPSLRSVGAWFFELPFSRWTRLQNTVVMGSTILGSMSALISYLILERRESLQDPRRGIASLKHHCQQLWQRTRQWMTDRKSTELSDPAHVQDSTSATPELGDARQATVLMGSASGEGAANQTQLVKQKPAVTEAAVEKASLTTPESKHPSPPTRPVIPINEPVAPVTELQLPRFDDVSFKRTGTES